ncbi:hypothetical protein [Nocardioides sp.]|uniref:hypothetical protein n=1 Tax=Nocardioides sp. TaxID=35761 RepID=UPI003565326D
MSEHSVDPAVSEAVQSIANRFGVAGLADLIAVAQEELETARLALEELADEGS